MLKYIILLFVFRVGVNLVEISYYEILGVSKQSTSQEIRQAYKKLAIKLHPDKNPDSSNQEKFLKITEAYETLKDPDKRHKYDLYGSQKSYSRKYDYKSQAEYDNLYYNGLYYEDPFVDTLSGNSFYNYLKDGFYFINFYSPFCPPCQNVADHWKKLAEMYKGIVKIGAVNCKYYNSFCYNSMRINSYPTLIFYPNGKNGNYLYYRGDRTLDALDEFLMKYLKARVQVPIVWQIRGTERPIAYVLGENRIGSNALTRIAFQLHGLVMLVLVDDDELRNKLATNDYATVVFKYKDISTEIESTEEKELLKEIVNQLPKVEVIDSARFQTLRTKLRSGATTPWVIYFSTEGGDRLEFHQKRLTMSDMHFGEINCDEWLDLCVALQATDPPAWGVLKTGGAYQRVDPRDIQLAAQATNLHTLSATEFVRILDADQGVWVLLVVPHRLSWNDVLEPFTLASIHFKHSNMNFGIMSCTAQTEQHCRRITHSEPAILVQNGTKRTFYGDRANQYELIEFIQMLKESADMELSEDQVLEILDVASRTHTWLVAHLPAHCGRFCDQLARQWMKVYSKLRPLNFVRVGVLKCKTDTSGFCTNIKMPTARLYPIASGHHLSVNLQQLNEAPYILEWALERIDESVQKLNWHSFTKTVIAEELNPTGAAKPWLIYFHSPRCYRCYELYPEFAIAGITLGHDVQLGRVNCLTERGICQHEGITSYPSLRLYLARNARWVSSVITLQIRDHKTIVEQVKEHLKDYSGNVLGVGAKHDEF